MQKSIVMGLLVTIVSILVTMNANIYAQTSGDDDINTGSDDDLNAGGGGDDSIDSDGGDDTNAGDNLGQFGNDRRR